MEIIKTREVPVVKVATIGISKQSKGIKKQPQSRLK